MIGNTFCDSTHYEARLLIADDGGLDSWKLEAYSKGKVERGFDPTL